MYVARGASSSHNLSYLPPDIIRNVLSMSKHRLLAAMLISKRWNFMVREHLSLRKNHPPISLLEFIHDETSEVVKIKIETNHYLPHHYCDIARYLFRGWIIQHSENSSFALQSPPKRIRYLQFVDLQWSLIPAVITLIIVLLLSSFAYNHVPLTEQFPDPIVLQLIIIPHINLTLIILYFFGYLAYLRIFIKPGVNENLARLKLISSRCANIDLLVFHFINQETLGIISKTLGDVTIKEIWIFDNEAKKELRDNLATFIRLNNLRCISICLECLNEADLRNLCNEVIVPGIDLDIWEADSACAPGKIFGRSKKCWDELARELSNNSFNIQLKPMTWMNDVSIITLASIPSDITRVILEMENGHLDSLRLISPMWNEMVVEYLSNRNNFDPLELIEFANYETPEMVKVKVKMSSHEQEERSLGLFSGWKAITADSKEIEITSPPLRFRTFSEDFPWRNIVAVVTILTVCISAVFQYNYRTEALFCSVSTICLLICLLLLFVMLRIGLQTVVYFIIKPNMVISKNLSQISRIYSRCSHIERLAFDGIERKTLNVIRKELGDVTVNWMYIANASLNEDTRKIILDFFKNNNVRCFTLYVTDLDEIELRNLFNQLALAGGQLDIWENMQTVAPNQVFGRPVKFWQDFVKEFDVNIEVEDGHIVDNWMFRLTAWA